MKPIYWIVLVVLALISCEQPATLTQSTTQVDSARLPQPATSVQTDSIRLIRANNIGPHQALQDFANHLPQLGWDADTTRLKTVLIYSELKRKAVQYFEGKPFYPINFKDSRIYKTYTSMNKGAPNFEVFQGVEYIWGYFYKDKKAQGMITDGVIEEWTFDTEQKAQRALEQLLAPKFLVYFNTTPYYCRLDNKVVIFQARASAFSYKQKAVFELFVKRTGVIID